MISLLLAIGTSSLGCKSLLNLKNVDLDLGGLELEFYEPTKVVTNYIQRPMLMPMSGKN